MFAVESIKVTCSYDYWHLVLFNRIFFLAMVIADFCVPLSFTFCWYFSIFRKYRQNRLFFETALAHRRNCSLNERKRNFRSSRRCSCLVEPHVINIRLTEWKLVRMAVLILTSLLISWTPYAVTAVIGHFADPGIVGSKLSVIATFMAKLSTAINPIIYTLTHPLYKTKLFGSMIPKSNRIPFTEE